MAANAVVTPRFFTVEQAAAYLQRSPGWIRNQIRSGALPVSPLGGYLIDPADLDRLVLKRKRIMPPYKKNSHPWVRARHAKTRAKATKKSS